MKFERLRLAGFKTFVEPTELTIAPGLTGVVGPNGCGKSNLVEALRWVMGETSSKSLRGGGMDDVIFGGSTTRPERNHAEVSIRIGSAPADLPGHLAGASEIDISRKIVREQGSTYRMNGREVRARDVQILFADAASGARSPSLVRQGQIGEIIAAKPQHRRRILEDAAGVAGLHARRHEAELRLKQAEDNLNRTEDVLGQLDRQISDLRKQARQSEKYKLIAAEIRDLELLLLASGFERANREASVSRRDHDLSVRAIAVAMAEQGEAERKRAIAEHEIDGLRRLAAEKSAALQALLVARETLDSEMRLAASRLKEIETRKAQAIRDVEAARQVLADADATASRLAEEDTDLVSKIATEEAGIPADQEAIRRSETVRVQAETAHGALQTEAAETLAALRAAAQRVQEAEARRDRLARGLADAERELGALAAGDEALQRIASLQATADARLADYEKALTTAEAAEKQGHATRAAEQAARPKLAEAERLLQRLETEARTIRKLVDNSEPDLWTPAVDLITVQPGYEAALAAALGDDLEAAVEAGAARHWGETALDTASLPPLPEGAVPVSSVVTAPAALQPRLSQIGLVTRDQGVALRKHLKQGQRLVSREGDLWRWDGFVARAEAPSAAARRLAERNRLSEIEANAVAAKGRRDEARSVLDAALSAMRKAQEQESAAREAIRRAIQARDTASAELQREMRRSEEARLRLEALRHRVEALKADRDEAEAQLQAATTARSALPAAEDFAPRISSLAAEAASARRAESEAQLAASQRKSRFQAAQERRGAIARERTAWGERTERARLATSEQAERLEALRAEGQRLEGVPDELAARRRTLETEIESARFTLREAEDALAVGETALRQADDTARKALATLSDAREASARLEAHAAHTAERLAHVTRQIEERIDGPIAGLSATLATLETMKNRSPEEIEARLFDLRLDRDKLGVVNLRADIELAEIENERGSLAKEREDVIEAIRKLRRAIDSLNSEGRTRLRAAFDVVNGHFGRLFERLFGGGSAELQLIEADDPLEAGLEILAKPPGKKPQLLSLLSGGEQALTATALIFAVFLTNPSPICVLDEVDAPLDDSNVERLCDLLRDMARETETRFMVITHNPISMARMDRLYGVTMVERGVSQLVSVDLTEAEKLAEAV
ncbi:MAG: chromosome segregation protein SMC [Rhizobiales bacterium PAR1]|nr:MAG: chromosome segregation protein SMC [Rhizobiales bacterium PAR1]